jgi:hypothetical protein
MRKIVFRIGILIAVLIAIAVVWIWRGPDVAAATESFGTILIRSEPVKSISYEGSGKGGVVHINDLKLDLTPANSSDPVPEIGTSKDGQVALSYAGKVFNFGPPSTSANDTLATAPAAGDQAAIEIRRSLIAWPNPFEVNFMTGNSPSWKRLLYQKLIWKKPNGAKLEMTWRCEQFFYRADGWTDACMADPGFTGLIHIEISNASQ